MMRDFVVSIFFRPVNIRGCDAGTRPQQSNRLTLVDLETVDNSPITIIYISHGAFLISWTTQEPPPPPPLHTHTC
jgi:hypothetical protein